MSESTKKMLEALREMGAAVSEKLYITGLFDTPTGYLGHSGDYLVVNDNESGIHFTGVEKIAQDLTDYGFLDGVGGGSGSSNIIFEASLSEMSNIPTSFTTASHIPYTPTIDTYSAWDTSINSWVAPKDMQVIATSMHIITGANSNVFADIRGDINYSYQSNVKDTQTPTHSYLNCAAIINLRAGEELRNRIIMQGGGNTASIQRFVIAELGGVGGGGSSTGGGQIHATFIGSVGQILTKSNNWDTYVDSISFPQGSWNGYARINYKNSFTNLPTVLATADHRENVSNPHVFAQVQAQTVDHCDIVIGDTEGTQVQSAFNVVIFSDEIAGGGSSSATTTFDALTDTPVDYINHSGKYLVVTDGEDGVGFSGIQKIAQDLEDFGFNGEGGPSYFTGLLDTPSDYINQSGKYVVVNNEEDGLSFVPAGDLLSLASLEGYDFCSDFHLQSNTTNNSSIFQDRSINRFSIGSNNVIHSNSATPVYGSSSLLFDGNAYLVAGNNQDFSIYSKKLLSSFTIQAYINPTLLNGNPQGILGNCGQITEHGFRFYIDSNDKLVFDICKGLGSQTSVSVTSSQSITVDQWQHIALVNNENTLTLYINGSDVGSAEWTTEASSITPLIGLHIGVLPMGSSSNLLHFNGYMQDIRIDRTAFNSQYFPPTELTNSTCNPAKLDIGFTSLVDSPANYTNAGGKYVRVSDNESELEFVGITVAGSTNNEFTNSFLNSDVTTDISIPEFNFGGLTVGKTYRLSSTICLNADTASDFPKIDFYNHDQKMFSLFSKGNTSTASNSTLFIARGDTVYASGRDLSSTAYIMGDQEISFVQLELPPSIAVELDEEVIPPVTQPGEGIFSIGSMNVHTETKDANTFSLLTEVVPQNRFFDIDSINTHVNLNTEFNHNIPISDLDAGIQPLNYLGIRDIKTAINIKPDLNTQSENLNVIIPAFSVLYISSINLSINTKNGNIDDQTTNLPHPNYIGTI